jgi:hypothetical protein
MIPGLGTPSLARVCQGCLSGGVTLVATSKGLPAPKSEPAARGAPEVLALRPYAWQIRTFAAAYAATGQKDRAQGLLQAADYLESGRKPDTAKAEPAPEATPAKSKSPLHGFFREPVDEGEDAIPPAFRTNGATEYPPELGTCEQAILAVLAQGSKRTRIELAIRSGYSVTSGGFDLAIRTLFRRGFIDSHGPRVGYAITETGRRANGGGLDLLTGAGLFEFWRKRFSPCAASILSAAVEHRGERSRVDLAGLTRGPGGQPYRVTSGGFDLALRQLRKAGLLTKGNGASRELVEAIS